MGGVLVAVITFGRPASPFLARGVCGKEFSDRVYELNRLCRIDELQEPLSQFVSACLRRLRAERWIIVSFSDTGMHHNGYIYQACNFIYTGKTKERTDIYSGSGKHSRHYTDADKNSGVRVLRTSKHRYVYFATSLKKEKKLWLQNLRYPILPYPKGENENYVLGQYQKQILVDASTGQILNTQGVN